MRLVEGEDPFDDCCKMILEKLEPRTTEQGTADWFLDRQLSGTSSTIAKLVVTVAPFIKVDDDIYDSFKTVLDYAGYGDILHDADNNNNNNEQDDANGNNQSTPNRNKANRDDNSSKDEEEEDRPVGQQEDPPAKQEAQQWINSLVDKDVDADAKFRAEAKTIAAETLSWMVALLKQKGYKLMTTKAALKFIGKDFLVHQKER